jgi:hypothetical protein
MSLPIDVSTESSVNVIKMCLSLDLRESYFLNHNMSETALMESLLAL